MGAFSLIVVINLLNRSYRIFLIVKSKSDLLMAEIAAAGMRKQFGIKDPIRAKKPTVFDLIKSVAQNPFVQQLSWHFVLFSAAVFFSHKIAPTMFDYSYLLE